MKNYVGRKIRGFKFESFGDVSYIPFLMDNCIGQEGVIKSQCDIFIIIEFKDGGWFRYPISMVEQYLLPIELELPKKGDRILVSDDEEKWKERIFLNYIEESLYPILCIPLDEEDYFKNGEKVRINLWKHWKPIHEKIKLTKQEIAYKFGINVEQLEITE